MGWVWVFLRVCLFDLVLYLGFVWWVWGWIRGWVLLFVVYDVLRLDFVGLDLVSMYLLVILWWLCWG